MNRLTFNIADDQGSVAITPAIDGIALTALVTDFEHANGYSDPAGGYGGIIPAYFSYGPLDCYFRGKGGNQGESDRDSEIYVLACDCGEVGCWPLMASVVATERGYRWEGFRQPHRPNRDYSAFGPFEFERQQYEHEVDGLP
jgi:hypothetical protein